MVLNTKHNEATDKISLNFLSVRYHSIKKLPFRAAFIQIQKLIIHSEFTINKIGPVNH